MPDLTARGEPAVFEDVLAGLIRRDELDSSRSVAPLRPAADAVVINTDQLSIDQVVARVVALARKWQD